MDELDGIHRWFHNPDMRTSRHWPRHVDTAIKAVHSSSTIYRTKVDETVAVVIMPFLDPCFYVAISFVENGVYPVSKQSLEQNHGKQHNKRIISGARAVDPSHLRIQYS